MKYWIVIVVLLYLTGPRYAVAETKPECAELLRNRCQTCHYLNRVCAQVGKKSKRHWGATLKRMVKRRGAELTEEEQGFLLDCLLAPAPDIVKECEK
jgi:hypothetical protein